MAQEETSRGRRSSVTGISDFRSIEEYRQWLRMDRLFSRYPVDRIRRWGLSRLPEVRSMVNGDYFQRLLDDWESALHDPDPSGLRSVALDTTSYGINMRQNNPLSGLLGEEENWRIIKESRDEQRAVLSPAARIG